MDKQPIPPDERTLDSYLGDLRSGKPTPGGGSASAYCAAFGASLGAMVCRLTLGRATPEVTETLGDLADSLDRLVDRLSRAARDDELSYGRYQTATRLPKATDDEKRVRAEARQTALELAAEAPLVTADLAVHALRALPVVASLGTRHALSDVESASVLLRAAVDSALINVQVNVGMIKDDTTVGVLVRRMSELRHAGGEAADQTRSALRARGA